MNWKIVTIVVLIILILLLIRAARKPNVENQFETPQVLNFRNVNKKKNPKFKGNTFAEVINSLTSNVEALKQGQIPLVNNILNESMSVNNSQPLRPRKKSTRSSKEDQCRKN